MPVLQNCLKCSTLCSGADPRIMAALTAPVDDPANQPGAISGPSYKRAYAPGLIGAETDATGKYNRDSAVHFGVTRPLSILWPSAERQGSVGVSTANPYCGLLHRRVTTGRPKLHR